MKQVTSGRVLFVEICCLTRPKESFDKRFLRLSKLNVADVVLRCQRDGFKQLAMTLRPGPGPPSLDQRPT